MLFESPFKKLKKNFDTNFRHGPASYMTTQIYTKHLNLILNEFQRALCLNVIIVGETIFMYFEC